jgi:hypothetical protein
MRIINIWVNGCLVSKDRDELIKWEEYALKNHYEFKINWDEVQDEKVGRTMPRNRKRSDA